MSRKQLRAHQSHAIELLRDSLRAGKKRPMLQAPVGFGKTLVAATIVRNAQERGKRILFIVDAIALVDQTVKAFFSEGVHSLGVIQADHEMTDWSKPVQVASVQTLQRRGMPRCDLVLIDEAHSQNTWLKEIMSSSEWAGVPFIGLSATPWSKGLGLYYDDLLVPISMADLIRQGFLSKFIAYGPDSPDLSKVKMIAGDYNEKQLSKVMSDVVLVANVVQTWLSYGQGVPTIAFCVDRLHAKKVQNEFTQAGIACEYIDAFTSREERQEIRRKLERGDAKICVSVGCLIKGIDWAIGCIIMARPTKSDELLVQMIGRGLRVNDGIGDLIILDHTDNLVRLGLPHEIEKRHGEMCRKQKGEKAEPKEKIAALPKPCPKCKFIKSVKVHICPQCGFAPVAVSPIENVAGELRVIGKASGKHALDRLTFYRELLGYCQETGKSEKFALANYREKYKEWPPRGIFPPIIPTQETRKWIKSRIIAYAKRKAA